MIWMFCQSITKLNLIHQIFPQNSDFTLPFNICETNLMTRFFSKSKSCWSSIYFSFCFVNFKFISPFFSVSSVRLSWSDILIDFRVWVSVRNSLIVFAAEFSLRISFTSSESNLFTISCRNSSSSSTKNGKPEQRVFLSMNACLLSLSPAFVALLFDFPAHFRLSISKVWIWSTGTGRTGIGTCGANTGCRFNW